jgi:hypothetical protein
MIPKESLNTTARIRLVMVRNNDSIDCFELRVTDERSGTLFFEAKMTMEQYAIMVGGNTEVGEIPLELRGLELVGLRRENKTVKVEFPLDGGPGWGQPMLDAVREHVEATYSADGWKASEYELSNFNGHRLKKNRDAGVQTYSIGIARYVEAD